MLNAKEIMIDDLRSKTEGQERTIKKYKSMSEKLNERIQHYEKVDRNQFNDRINALLMKLSSKDNILSQASNETNAVTNLPEKEIEDKQMLQMK